MAGQVVEMEGVRLTMPEGCVPDPYFVFTQGTGKGEERVRITRDQERDQTDPAVIVKENLAEAKDIIGDAMQIYREGPVTVQKRPGYEAVVIGLENDGSRGWICQVLVNVKGREFLEIKYTFLEIQPGTAKEKLADFDRMKELVRFADDGNIAPRREAPPGWRRHDLFDLSLYVPEKFQRGTAFTFIDPARGIKWAADAARIMQPQTVEQDGVSMRATKSETLDAGPIAGTARMLEKAGAGAGEVVARADIVIDRQWNIVMRGRGPKAQADKMLADVKQMAREGVNVHG